MADAKCLKHLNGTTKMRTDVADQFGKRFDGWKSYYYDNRVHLKETLVNDTILSNIPIRAAKNTPENYGGIRIENLRGQGQVFCHMRQIEFVMDRQETNELARAVYIAKTLLSKEDFKNFEIYEDATAKNISKFLDLYDQPVPPNDKKLHTDGNGFFVGTVEQCAREIPRDDEVCLAHEFRGRREHYYEMRKRLS